MFNRVWREATLLWCLYFWFYLLVAVRSQITGASTISSSVLSSVPFSTIALDSSTPVPSTTPGVVPRFSIRPDPQYPWGVLQIFYSPQAELAGFMSYKVNYTDKDTQHPTGSYAFNEPAKTFSIYGLNAGHEYSIEIWGIPPDSNLNKVPLFKTVSMTEPKSPDFSAAGAVTVTANSISLKGKKPPGALQDNFKVSYSQLDPIIRFDPLIVQDIAEQKLVELYLGNLNAGRNYNISVSASRKNKTSRPWHTFVTTTPLPPSSVQIIDLQANTISLKWNAPLNSGVDSYRLTYKMVQDPSAHAVKVNDLEGTNLTLSKLSAGKQYEFTVVSLKGGQTSQGAVVLATTRPLAPESLSIEPDYEKRSYKLTLHLPASETAVDGHCGVQILLESEPDLGAPNRTVPISDGSCVFHEALRPGERYQFRAWTISNGAKSTTFTRTVPIKPAFDANKFGIKMTWKKNLLQIEWPQTEPERTELQLLWEALVGQSASLHTQLTSGGFNKQRSGNLTAHITYESLEMGTCYELLMYTVASTGIISDNQTFSVRAPAPQAVLSVSESTQTSATIKVKLSDRSSDCQLRFNAHQASSGALVKTDEIPLTEQVLTIQLEDLRAYSRYRCIAMVQCGAGENDRCSLKKHTPPPFNFETAQGKPGPVRNCSVSVERPYMASVSWTVPQTANGVIESYELSVNPQNSLESSWNLTVSASNADQMAVRVSNLTGGLQYEFDVRAKTRAGLGQSAMAGGPFVASGSTVTEPLSVLMPVWAPPTPLGKPEILANTIRSTDFSVRFDMSMLSTRHGLLEKYAIIVVQTDERGAPLVADANKTALWPQVQHLDIWPPYVALEKSLPHTKHLEPSTVTEVLGVDEGCVTAVQHPGFCNGPLRPSRHYRVKLRAYTRPQLFSDSEFSELVMTESDPGARAVTAVLSVILSLLLLLLIALTLVLLLKKRSKLRMTAANCLAKLGLDSTAPMPNNGLMPDLNHHRRSRSLRERTGADARLERLSSPSVGHRFSLPPIPTVLSGHNLEQSRPVRKVDFKEHVRLMSADSDFRFSEEYEDLKQVGRGQPYVAADLAGNRSKNRFTNILPYDHSRVKLVPVDDEEGTDYINASYIPGYNSPREFIAAQGPLPSTRDDFWRMIWEQQCPAVINLTRCVEKGRDKCHKYWPETTEPVAYGDIEVTMMNETRAAEWTIREFRLTHLEEAGAAERTLKHFHYVSWPDFGVPNKPQSLVQFVRSFRAKIPQNKACKPTVCHCSAGVGRSGTFIALDYLLQSALESETVDVFAVVHQMRKERVWMVQTEQQYICIHQSLLCVLEGRENDDLTPPTYPLAVSPPIINGPPPPRIEVHQNPAFEDDEGIAESGV